MNTIIALAGMLLALVGFGMSGGDPTLNLGLLNLKTNLVIAGAALFVGGLVSDAATRTVKAIVDNGETLRRLSLNQSLKAAASFQNDESNSLLV